MRDGAVRNLTEQDGWRPFDSRLLQDHDSNVYLICAILLSFFLFFSFIYILRARVISGAVYAE